MTDRTQSAPGARTGVWTGAWLTALVLGVAIIAFLVARGFVPATTRYFPVGVAAACIILAALDLVRRALRARAVRAGARFGAPVSPEAMGFLNEAANAPALAVLRYAAWFFGYLAGIALVSLVVASGVFVAAFLRVEAKLAWWLSLALGVFVTGFVIFIGHAFSMRWPASLISPLRFLL